MNNSQMRYPVSVTGRNWLTSEVYELNCTRPEGFKFRCGQHVSLGIDEEERYYTIVSPEHSNSLSFLIKKVPQGIVSIALATLPIGSTIEINSARGYLVPRVTERQRVFVATGTGIAPFVSMISSGKEVDYLLHGARDLENLYYQDSFADTVSFYIRCLSRQPRQVDTENGIYTGYVTTFIEHSLPRGIYDFYLCGKWDMIREVTHAIDKRFPDANIYSEGFY